MAQLARWIGVVTRATSVPIALMAGLFLLSSTAFALGSGEKSPEEEAADNQKKAVSEYNDGVKHVDKAREIGIKGDSLYAYNYRATSDAKARKEYEKAVENFTKAVELDTAMHEAHNYLGYCYRKLGDLPKSLAAYDRALTLKPDFAQAREYRGETYLAMGDIKQAEAELAYLKKIASPFADTLGRSIEVYQLAILQNAQKK
ncbi:MAG: tetratricopeptide repeat protein [bacterium]|nr:tetratricopeptide repeat protein [bacterium]